MTDEQVTAPDLAAGLAEAYKYADGIRNAAKKSYAFGFLHQTVRNGLPAPDRGELSFMGAQAVELRITSIMRGDHA